jgi:hypothetical protein
MELFKRIQRILQRGSTKFLIFIYLIAIVAANMIITKYGPSMSIVTAFIFIGLDLTSRDHLHETWKGEKLFLKMGLLIGTGSIISWFINRSSGQIALASFLSFAVSGGIDSIVYHILKNKTRFIKINGSNVFGSAFDSVLFPTIAFGVFMPIIILGQFFAKVFGGIIWFYILNRFTFLDKTSKDSA